MNIDEKVRNELEKEASELDHTLNEKQGLLNQFLLSCKGSLRRWFIIVNIVTMIVSIFMVWSGYEFFIATAIQQQVFWGICFLITLNAQIALKQWLWMEMNRGSLMREIKRVEVSVVQLETQLKNMNQNN